MLELTSVYFASVTFGCHLMPNNRNNAPTDGSFGWLIKITSGDGRLLLFFQKSSSPGNNSLLLC